MLGYPQIEPWTECVTRVLAPNPGPMTLDGTNTLVLRRPDSHRTVVVDPGPRDSVHLRRILKLGEVELILLTHRHHDHSDSAGLLARLTGAPVRAADPSFCVDAAPLADGEEIHAGGLRVGVIATPGHTADSVSFRLERDRDLADSSLRGSLLTGDTILGRGTTVIAPPDGSLSDYFATLDRMISLRDTTVLPAHGDPHHDVAAVASAYREHRLRRLAEIDAAVGRLRESEPRAEVTVAAVTDLVYADAPADVRFAAEMSVAAQLDYLSASGCAQR